MKKFALACLFAATAWARVGTPLQQAPPEVALLANPFTGQEAARRAGAKLFARECAACHGRNAAGGLGKAPTLTFVSDAEPGKLFWVLRNGSLRRGMPSFAHLPEPQRWQIVTYLQSLRKP